MSSSVMATSDLKKKVMLREKRSAKQPETFTNLPCSICIVF